MLAQDKRIKRVHGALWLVPSQTQNSGGYLVNRSAATCTCPDHELHGSKCKHQWAVEFYQSKASPVKVKVSRKSYTRNWPKYNAAQCAEKATVQTLLRSLCDGIQTPPHPGRGPKPIPLSDVVYGMTMKVYTTVSGRRAMTDLKACADEGHMSRAPHYNSLFNYFEKPEMTPLLTALVEKSAAPLSAIESAFAADSTGFSTCIYRRWFDAKYGRQMREHGWIKAHVMTGVITHVVTAIAVTDGSGADAPELPALVCKTRERFDVREVSADKAYLTHHNLAAVESVGAVPYVPFKSNSKKDGSDAWRRMWGLFVYRKDEFLAHYHRRSNIETTFSMIKLKFSGAVRSKSFQAQVNEVLCKVLCHNLAVVAYGMHALSIEPNFTPSRPLEMVS